MKEISYRSIFPDNNIPSEVFRFTPITLKQRLREEIASLIDRVDFSEISAKVFQLEFKIQVEQDPVNTLLEQLREKSAP